MVGFISAEEADRGSSPLLATKSPIYFGDFFCIMEHVVYILYSRRFDKTYVGCTSSIISRFHSHNTYATKGWTVRYRPWEVFHIAFFDTKPEALSKEKWFKTGAGRRHKDTLVQAFLKSN
ncbi:hypothetical protein SCB49_00390 [unidentified eubacterium SCB49]|nr:hypothetical protein SCB49_00390 [unidentified eubacterium SCB49]